MAENDKSQDQPQEPEKDIGLFVYTGEWAGKNHKTLYEFLEIDKKTHYPISFDDVFLTDKPPKYSKRPGAIFEIRVAKRNENGKAISIYSRGYTPRGFIKNEEMIKTHVLNWQARMKAKNEQKTAIKESKRDLIVEHLAPLKEAYYNMTPAQKKAFIAYILTYIQRP